MKYNKEVWAGVLKYTKLYLFVFLFSYFAADMWRLSKGDLFPLRKKGILLEWYIKKADDRTFTAVRVTYTYNEPLLLNNEIISSE
jgi:hypothetical protein